MFSIPTLSRRALVFIVGGSFLVAACTTAATVNTDTAGGAATVETATDETAAELDWRDIELTDVTTGDTFTLASLKGSVVAIEPFAVWCTNCHIQQDNVKSVYAELEAAGVKFVSLGVEPNESPDRIADYQDRRGYEWTFAQSPIEFSRALRDEFGAQILAVPATPLIVLSADGEVVFEDVGFHGPDSLREIFDKAAA